MLPDTNQHETAPPPDAVAAIRAKLFSDFATIAEYAQATRKTERTIWNWIALGLPVTYIGRTPHIVVSESAKFWASRACRQSEPKRGRPRKIAA